MLFRSPLKNIVTGSDSLKLIDLENQLNKEDIYSAFDEHLSTKELDEMIVRLKDK